MIRNLIIVMCVLLFTACSKDTDSNLFGKWQLQQVEANGVVEAADTVFFNFQNSLFMYQVYIPTIDSMRECYGYCTEKEEKTILLEMPGVSERFLRYTDWTSDKRTYTIDKVTTKQLILSSEDKTYTFRKH